MPSDKAARKRSLFAPEGETLTPEGSRLKPHKSTVQQIPVGSKKDEGQFFVRYKDGTFGVVPEGEMVIRGKDGKFRLKSSDRRKKGPEVIKLKNTDPNRKFQPGRRYKLAGSKITRPQSTKHAADVLDEKTLRSSWFVRDMHSGDIAERLMRMENGCFFIRHSAELPDDAFVLHQNTYGVPHEWLLEVDDQGVGLKRSGHRFLTLYQFVLHYAAPTQQDLDIPLNLGRLKAKPKKSKSKSKKSKSKKSDWRLVKTVECEVDDPAPTQPQPQSPQFPFWGYPMMPPMRMPAPVIHVNIDNGGGYGGYGGYGGVQYSGPGYSGVVPPAHPTPTPTPPVPPHTPATQPAEYYEEATETTETRVLMGEDEEDMEVEDMIALSPTEFGKSPEHMPGAPHWARSAARHSQAPAEFSKGDDLSH
mmetsp:Transcript_30237/g.90687  ORF Transcript_30237/g.90687 Transcript_30237/m.90687 type:complete len:417 (-) Transcript_30237:99-1349(-)